MPPKVWLPKPKDHFEPEDELFSDDLFIHKEYEKCIFHDKASCNTPRTDPIQQWDEAINHGELDENLHVGKNCMPELQLKLEDIIQGH